MVKLHWLSLIFSYLNTTGINSHWQCVLRQNCTSYRNSICFPSKLTLRSLLQHFKVRYQRVIQLRKQPHGQVLFLRFVKNPTSLAVAESPERYAMFKVCHVDGNSKQKCTRLNSLLCICSLHIISCWYLPWIFLSLDPHRLIWLAAFVD